MANGRRPKANKMPTIWYDAVVRKIEEIAPNVRQFLVEIPELDCFEFKAGQFVTLDLPLRDSPSAGGASIANGPNESNHFELCIVQSEAGLGSKYLFESVTEGSILRLKGPDGNFCLPDRPDNTLVMVCTGTGIAPFSRQSYRICWARKATRVRFILLSVRAMKAEYCIGKKWSSFHAIFLIFAMTRPLP